MSGRILAAVVCVAAAVLGTAAATSLGPFQDVVLTAEARSERVCHVADPATDVTFYDGGGAVDLLTGVVGSLLGDIEEIKLTDLSGDCAGMRPVVIAIGHDGGDPDESVLSRTELGPILDGTLSTVTRAVDVGDEINSLLSIGDEVTEVRVAFCPVNATQCGVDT